MPLFMADMVTGMPIKESYYNRVLPELRKKSEDLGYQFYSTGTPGAPMSELLDELVSGQPGVRHPFGIETVHSVLVGFITTPEPTRKFSEKVWNRLKQNERERIERAERKGYESKSLSFLVIQVWEREERCVLISYKDLEEILDFRKTGNFTVKKEDGEFFLQKPSYEPKRRLKDKLDQIFEYL